MNANAAIRAATGFSVSVVACIAAIISYSHIYRVALAHGQTELDARLLPFSVDGLITAASLTLFYASRNRLTAPGLARWMLGLGIVATVAVNAIYGASGHGYGLPQVGLSMVLSAWPSVAFVGAVELVIWMVRAATAVGGASRARNGRTAGGASRAEKVRTWGRFNGFDVSDRGRIPSEVLSAYREANCDHSELPDTGSVRDPSERHMSGESIGEVNGSAGHYESE